MNPVNEHVGAKVKAALEASDLVGKVHMMLSLDPDVRPEFEAAVTDLALSAAGHLLATAGQPNSAHTRGKLREAIQDGAVPKDVGRIFIVCDESNNTADDADARRVRVTVHMEHRVKAWGTTRFDMSVEPAQEEEP